MKITVVGCGKIGCTVINALLSEGHEIVAIDNDPDVISDITNIYDVMTVCGSGTDSDVLLEAGNANLLIAVTGSDEFNMLTCFIAKRLGIKHTIARIRKPEYNDKSLSFLKKELGHKPGHVNHCLCWLNRLIYIAVDREILRANPIEDVAYEKKEPLKLRHISRGELKRMMETPLPDPMMELARRTFIFSSLTGLAYADTRALHPRHIGKTSEGRKYIRVCRAKTDVEAFIPLHPIAEQILELYNTTDDDRPVFPLPVRDVLWYEVHGMGVALGMKENLSYHMARHSFGTLMLSSGIPIESIAKMMGHTNINSTQVYAQVTDRKISGDMDQLMKRRQKGDTVLLTEMSE